MRQLAKNQAKLQRDISNLHDINRSIMAQKADLKKLNSELQNKNVQLAKEKQFEKNRFYQSELDRVQILSEMSESTSASQSYFESQEEMPSSNITGKKRRRLSSGNTVSEFSGLQKQLESQKTLNEVLRQKLNTLALKKETSNLPYIQKELASKMTENALLRERASVYENKKEELKQQQIENEVVKQQLTLSLTTLQAEKTATILLLKEESKQKIADKTHALRQKLTEQIAANALLKEKNQSLQQIITDLQQQTTYEPATNDETKDNESVEGESQIQPIMKPVMTLEEEERENQLSEHESDRLFIDDEDAQHTGVMTDEEEYVPSEDEVFPSNQQNEETQVSDEKTDDNDGRNNNEGGSDGETDIEMNE